MAAIDYHNTGTTAPDSVYAANWRAQTFAATGNYSIGSVKIHVNRGGVASGNVIVSIRATDGSDKPTGGDLASCTLPVTDLPVVPAAADWVEFTLDSPVALTNGTLYAIVCRAPSCTGATGNAIYWTYTYSSNYAGGKYVTSTDSGSTWGTPNSTVDFWFETYEPAASYAELEGTIAGTGSVSGTLTVTEYVAIEGTITGTGYVSGTLSRLHLASPLAAGKTRLVACGNNELWYEDV